MLFADDIVLVAETKKEVNSKLEERMTFLEGRGWRISRTKIEYLQCNFSGTQLIGELEVTKGEGVAACTTEFGYLGSVIHSNGEIDEDINYRIQAGRLK